MINCASTTVVNGPEVFGKYIGDSEKNTRAIFDKAFIKPTPGIHLIIIDEIYSICKTRENGGHDTKNAVVNQLLTMIDGVDSPDNFLVIGMTNRKELLDLAILHPGRLEVHLEIFLPDEAGRVQILNIHTKGMAETESLDKDVCLEDLAKETGNFSGFELEALCKSVFSIALEREHTEADATGLPLKVPVVSREDFNKALADVTPTFGAANKFKDQEIIPYSVEFKKLLRNIKIALRTNARVLLLGDAKGVGTTTIATHVTLTTQFPFVKVVTPETLWVSLSRKEKG